MRHRDIARQQARDELRTRIVVPCLAEFLPDVDPDLLDIISRRIFYRIEASGWMIQRKPGELQRSAMVQNQNTHRHKP